VACSKAGELTAASGMKLPRSANLVVVRARGKKCVNGLDVFGLWILFSAQDYHHLTTPRNGHLSFPLLPLNSDLKELLNLKFHINSHQTPGAERLLAAGSQTPPPRFIEWYGPLAGKMAISTSEAYLDNI